MTTVSRFEHAAVLERVRHRLPSLLLWVLFAASAGCDASHLRSDAAVATGTAADAATGVLCPDAVLEVRVPDDGCASFTVASGTPAHVPDRLACTRVLPGYRVRVASSGRVGLVLTLDHVPSCEGSECIAGFGRLDPAVGCSIGGCTYGGRSPLPIDGPRSPITELFIYPIAPGQGPLAGTVCASP